MKKIALIIILLGTITGSFAQRGPQNGYGKDQKKSMRDKGSMAMLESIPDLTQEQEKTIRSLMVDHQKEVMPLRNELMIKKAELNALETTDGIDQKKIDRLIEEMGAIKIKMHKSMAKHKQEIRKVLNEEQRIWFDSQLHMRKMKAKRGAGYRGR